MNTLPWRSALLCKCAASASLIEGLRRWLVYDRAAVGQGQWWRLLSGNLVHFSTLHAAMDLVAVLIAGGLLERRGYPHYWSLCLLSAAAVGAAVQWLRPDLGGYGGLSGIAMAMVATLCLEGLREGGAWAWICAAALALLLAKLGWELATGSSLSAAAGEQAYLPVPQAHAAGVAAAALLFGLRRIRRPECAGSSRGSSATPRWNP